MTDNNQPPDRFVDPAGRYRIDSKIATGGMGVVWKGTDTRLGRTVAVKVLKSEYADDPTFRSRFESEARSAAALHHPGIAGMFDYSSDAEAPYLVMEYVDGEPLSVLIARAKEAGRPMDPEVVRDLLAQTADALAVAHRGGIVHRDIKPANLLITPDRRVKITDFGIARAGDATAITRTGAVMGTPQYLSPEQARGNASTPASDVYSLGVVAFECLAGARPFEAESPVATVLAHLQQPVPDLPPEVPSDLAEVVRRAMAKEPADRFSDGAAFAAALRDPSAMSEMGPATTVLPATADIPVAGAGAVPVIGQLDPVAAYEGEEQVDDKDRFPWGVLIAVILLVLGIVLAAWLLLSGGDDDDAEGEPTPTRSRTTEAPTTPTTEPTTPTTTAPATVDVNADDYVGRDFRDVEGELSDLGLQVRLEEATNDGSQTYGVVSSVSPSGTVNEGETITVTYWGAAPSPTEEPTTEPTEPTTTPPAESLPTDSTAPEDAP